MFKFSRLVGLSTLLALFCFIQHAQSEVSYRGGVLDINVSGADGSYGGQDGGPAGDVNINLSYLDAAKTQVKIDGETVLNGKRTAISQIIPISELKQISIKAFGGDGGAGFNGRDGYNGMDGRSGWDGCPPGNGENGSDGGDGGPGGPGGDGGRGGQIHIVASGEQTEILLFVKAQSSAGSGGRGGSGGSGGYGGRGGRGGRNNCVDSHGHPTNGPDGRDGWDGRSGSSGSSGYSGRDGAAGSKSFDVIDNGQTHSYPAPFSLSLIGAKTIDENEDGILQPGENLNLLQIQIANKGPMPTPTAQALNFLLQNSSTLLIKKMPTLSVNEVIQGNQTKTLSFSKGDVVLQAVAHDPKLLGEKAILNEKIGINNVSLSFINESGFSLHWPIGVSAAKDSGRAYFASAETIAYSLHNVSSKDIGPSGTQPAEVEFSWVSSGVPGADVTVTLKDGRSFTMDQPHLFTDFTIPAKSNFALPVNFLVQNSKKQLTSNGKLKVTLKLRNFANSGEDTVDAAGTAMFLAIDLRPVAVNRHFDLPKRTMCNYPLRQDPQPLESRITALDLFKDKGSDRMGIRYYMDGQKSPSYSVAAFDFAIYTDLIQTSPPLLVMDFLNQMLAEETKKGQEYWYFSGCF